jgi:pimeloyl-ACP methyl ester carboxylesterase
VARLRKGGRDRDDPAGFCAAFWGFMGRLVVYRPPAPSYQESCKWPREWPASLDGHFKAIFGSLAGAPVTPASVAQVAAPVLVIHGRHDRQVPLGAGREWALTWRQARLITIEEGAHAPFLDDPSVVADIDQFLAGTWPRRAEEVRTLVPQGR